MPIRRSRRFITRFELECILAMGEEQLTTLLSSNHKKAIHEEKFLSII